jgi:hypothetical protein
MKILSAVDTFVLVILSIGFVAGSQPVTFLNPPIGPIYECWGKPTNGLQPHFRVGNYLRDWRVEIDFLSQGDFSDRTWLLITNQVGSQLKLATAEGIDIALKDTSARAAWSLPSMTSVSNNMLAMRRLHRGAESHLWWRTDTIGSFTGQEQLAYSFDLKPCFDFPPSRDLVLEIAPLIYRVADDEESARLVEFPPVKIVLSTNGSVRQLGEATTPDRTPNLPQKENTLFKISGAETDGLVPVVYLYKSTPEIGWDIEVGVRVEGDASGYQLFRVKNNFSSRIRLWQRNGSEVPSSNRDLESSFLFPKELGNLSKLDRLYRIEGQVNSIAAFGLRYPFKIFLTNDALLEITPLIYKMETNSQIARLVNFQPIRITLHTNGIPLGNQ